MPRYVIERDLSARVPAPGSTGWRKLIERNADPGVTWLHSYLGEDGRRAFCVYEADAPEAVRRSAALNALPVERITQIRVLDSHLYEWHGSGDRARQDNRRSS